MSLVVSLRFVVKFCVDFLAWPLLGLVYPLFASIWAIETNSVSDTQKLNTYWVVYSLILFLERSLNLLQWFWYWYYIRLIIVCSLVVPHFDGAFYVYKQVICPCLSIDPRIIIDWFAKPKESLTETEKILAEVEKYVRQNGTEALEKLISSKSGNSKNLEAKEIEAVSSSESRVVVNERSGVESKLVETENRASSSGETKKTVCKVTARKEPPQTSAVRAVQKEWTCAICRVTTQSEVDFISHLQDDKHKAVDELGKASKNQTLPKITPLYNTPKKSEEKLGNSSKNLTVPPKVVFSRKVPNTCDHGSTDYNTLEGWYTWEPTVSFKEMRRTLPRLRVLRNAMNVKKSRKGVLPTVK